MMVSGKWFCRRVALLCLAMTMVQGWAQQPHELAARAEVDLRLLAESPPPVGTNEIGDMGGFQRGQGNLIRDNGFEPGVMRYRYRVLDTGTEDGRPWMTLDGLGVSRADLVGSGFLSGADYRIYRIVGADGNPLPLQAGEDYLDLSAADRYVRVAQGQVPPEGTPGLPDGGWVVQNYSAAGGGATITRTNTDWTYDRFLENGRTYSFLVAAVNTAGEMSVDLNDPSAPGNAVEVQATPQPGLAAGPYIIAGEGSPTNDMRPARAGDWFAFSPRVVGADGTVTWSLLDQNENPLDFGYGLAFSSETGELSGVLTETPPQTLLRFRATAENGTTTRDFVINNPDWTPAEPGGAPAPPQNVTALAGDGFVHLTWDPSPDPDVVGYRLFVSPVPLAQTQARVYLEQGAEVPRRWDYIHFDKETMNPDPDWSHPRVRTGRITDTWRQWWDRGNFTFERVPHPVPPPPEMAFPGESCLAISSRTTEAEMINGPTIFHALDGSGEAAFYGYLEPGETYVYEAWLRHEGLSTPQATLTMWGQYEEISQSFALTGEWQLCRFTFTAPDVPRTGGHGGPGLQFPGPGTVYMDNPRLVRADLVGDVPGMEIPHPENMAELAAFNPADGPRGPLRNIYASLRQSFMDKTLSTARGSRLTFDWFQAWSLEGRPTLPFHLNVAYRTGDSPETRMAPWINISPFYTPDEVAMLIEYLAAPVDLSDPDDVAAKPWAHLRAQQRGTSTPWIDEFDHLIFEFGNETWHNQSVEEVWAGWGRTFAINQGGREYGLYMRYMLDEVYALAPETRNLIDQGRLRLSMGDAYASYALAGLDLVPEVNLVGHGTYIGPRWETGDASSDVFDDDGMQTALLSYAEGFRRDLEVWRREREDYIGRTGHDFDFVAYEGNASGYALPGTVSRAQEIINERYGKSLAMGMAFLDGTLAAYEAGFRKMAYYSFSARETWASHTVLTTHYPNGYLPHSSWLAIQMRNRFASGDLIAVNFPQVPLLERTGGPVPLVGGYAFRNGSELAIFLLSRKLDGQHSGLDFGDGSTDVTLVLPATPTGPATLHQLSGDPRANNIETQNLTIQTSTLDLQRETTINLPAGSVYLLVANTDLPADLAPPAEVANLQAAPLATSTLLSWDPVPGASAYRIRRSTTAMFNRAEEEDVFTSDANSFEDPDAVGGTTYHYRVAAVNAWGEGMASTVAVTSANPNAPTLPAPLLLGAGVRDGALRLTWEQVPGAVAYRVGFRTGSTPYTWLHAGENTTYLLQNLTNGVPVSWTAQALGESERGAIAPPLTAAPLSSDTPQPLVSWNLTNASSYEEVQPASANVDPVQASALVRGAGFIVNGDTPGYHPLPGTFGFFPLESYESHNFGNLVEGGSLQMALERDYYIGFTLTPQENATMTIEAVETGLAYPFYPATLQAALRYRVGAANWQDAPGGAIAVPGEQWLGGDPFKQPITYDLSTVTELRDLSEPVEFRIYVYSLDEDARFCRAGLGTQSGPGLQVQGTYSAPLITSTADQWQLH